MKIRSSVPFLGLLLALTLAVAGCPGNGSNNPDDGGTDGNTDGNVGECTTALDCDDGNVCTDDTCVDTNCVHTNNAAPCDDGQACSENDVCSAGVCSGTAVGCDDGNACTNDTCDETGCVYVPNMATCDDGNACTLGDVCSAGSCTGGAAITCEDANECTDDACDPGSGCVYTNNTAACDDGQACSSNDQCSNGVCVGDSAVECDDANPCTEDRCDDALGCVHSFNMAPCDDGNACTANDACSQGSCTGQVLDCDDGNLCTNDTCDPASGCGYTNNTDPCDDGNDCSVGDTCANGACAAGGARDCNDLNACTDDSCIQGLGCTHANNSAACDDGNPCTDGDMCQAGSCVGGGAAFDCDDGDPCTDDACDPVNGCSYSYNTAACDDGNACTITDMCANGVCSGGPMDVDGDGSVAEACGGDDCDDSNFDINPGVFEGPAGDATCTDGVDNNCNDLTDLAEATCGSCNSDPECNDGNVCNGSETCVANNCVAGTPLTCNDAQLCTNDTCDAVNGCEYSNNTLPCNDGNACTTGDICGGGSCQAGAGSLVCNDSNPCTDDSCAPASGCETVNNNDNCNDGDDCTTGDFCQAGVCQAGAGGPDCDDSNPCTDDSCVAGACANVADDANACDDNSLCTTNDRCSGGNCVGNSISCDDSNVCTSNECEAAIGCVYNPQAGNCDDGDVCTESDACSGGNCIGAWRDQDVDGYGDGTGSCGGDDCNDNDFDINPGVSEVCGDGVDNNCNDVIDENCSACGVVDPAAMLQIDNDAPLSGYGMAVGDKVFNIFIIESTSYNVIEVDASFYDFSGGSGNAQGNFQVKVYADAAGLPGAELGSSAVELVNVAWPELHTFTLSSPVAFTQGQLIWVAIESTQDQTANGFLPLVDGGIAVPYMGGALYVLADDDYYGVVGNFILRVQGCGEGPWLTLADHSESQQALPAGGSITSTASLRNRGFADASGVVGVMTADPEIVLTTDTSNFNTIAQGGTVAGAPAYGISADAAAYGIFPMVIDSTDGPGSWADAYGVYVQGSGCGTENAILATDNGVGSYIIAPEANHEMGNYYVVQSTSFALTSVDTFMQNTTGPGSSNFRVRVYTYRAGLPDKVIFQSPWQSVSGADAFNWIYNLPTPLTFKQGDTFYVMIQSQSDLSATDFSLITDDGDSATSWYNGLLNDGTGWAPLYLSFIVRLNGCQSTELIYDSHSSNPDPIQKGQSASLNIMVRNTGAEDAVGVSGTLSSSTGDVTITTATRSFGTVAADSTGSASGFQISVAAGAADFQYLLDLQLTDGTNTWDTVVPIQLAGGSLNLAVQNFSTSLVGNDIQYHWEVVNTGNVDIVAAFDVDLYIDRASAPGVGVAGDWTDSPTFLGVGQNIPYDLVLPNAPTGDYDAWVQVDTNNAIAETNEGDNVDGPSTVSVGQTDIFELLNPPRKWFPADMPVGYRFVSNNSQAGLTQASARDAVRVGFAQWQNVASASITFAEGSQGSNGSGGFTNDGYNTMSFDDPYGELPAGVLGATLVLYNGQTMVTNGVTFYRIDDCDMVINNNISYVRNGDSCNNDFDLDGVATHELGHLVGLDHPDVFDATMYYAIGPCDMGSVSLETSDINGVTFIYP